MLAEVFDNHAVTWQHETEWPLRSTDHLLFRVTFLWIYMKCPVFATPPLTIINSFMTEAVII